MAFTFSMRVGLPRIDIAAWWSIGGYVTALAMSKGVNFFLAAPIAGIVAAILGWVLFSFILPRGIVTFFVFSILGLLATPELIQFLGVLPFFRSVSGVLPPATIGTFQIVTQRNLFYLGLFFLTINLVVYHLLLNSRIGRAWDAISVNLQLARSAGVNVVRYRMANLLIGNFFIALAGSFFIAFYRAQVPFSFGLQNGVLIMIYPLFGGITHSLAGPIIGAILANFIPVYYLSFTQQYQLFITAGAGILIIVFLRQGILGVIDRVLMLCFGRFHWYKTLVKPATNYSRLI
jgi:branched-chain amino acid transport system permease protein